MNFLERTVRDASSTATDDQIYLFIQKFDELKGNFDRGTTTRTFIIVHHMEHDVHDVKEGAHIIGQHVHIIKRDVHNIKQGVGQLGSKLLEINTSGQIIFSIFPYNLLIHAYHSCLYRSALIGTEPSFVRRGRFLEPIARVFTWHSSRPP